MAQLAANRSVPNTLQQRMDLAGGIVVDMVMTASATIYEGACVGYVPATGTVHALVDSDAFAGIALEKKVASATAGATKISVFINGYFSHLVTGTTVASNGLAVFAVSGTSDNSLDVGSTTMPAVGKIANWVSGTTCIIEMKHNGGQLGTSNAATLGYVAVEG